MSPEKIKVVWICHFYNENVRNTLQIEGKNVEFAPWITLSINEIEKRNDIELHVVAPLAGLRFSRHYTKNDIRYYFIKTGIPFLKRNWPSFFKLDYYLKYRYYAMKIERTVRKINPQIINLHGAENPYYASSILRLLDFPVLVNVQGIFSSIMAGKIKTKFDRLRSDIENQIYRQCRYFGIRADFMQSYIRNINPDAVFYTQYYPIKKPEVKTQPKIKSYDLVFFARITKEKGIEDLVDAVYILKSKRPDISLCVIGPVSPIYLKTLEEKIRTQGLEQNIVIKGPMQTQDMVYEEAIKAKISVLPTHNDTLPGTIIESIHLGLPVISYAVGSIPDLNRDDENIILVTPGDIAELAKQIGTLLEDEQKRLLLSAKAKKFIESYYNNSQVVGDLLKIYPQILNQKLQQS